MSTETFTIKKSYQLSAVKADETRVWFDTDPHSGGYPYWSTWHNNRTFDSLDKIPTLREDDYMRRDVVRVEILEVEIVARVVDSTVIVSAAKAKAMAEIQAIQKELEKKLSLLEGMK